MRRKSAEDALMSKVVGRGSRKGSTLIGRTSDVVARPPTWGALATLLATTGPGGRRAALRGSVCYLTAAVLHLPIKAVVGRKHPQGAARLQLGPFTSSFPSGHSAGEAAFVLGASQEIRPLLLPLSAAMLAANWSLLRKRSHYPSDIMAGWVLGSAVAFAAWKLWPTKESADEPSTIDDDRADTGQPATSDQGLQHQLDAPVGYVDVAASADRAE